MSKSDDNMPKEFPSVHLAYPVAMEAYEWAARRMDTMDSRIQTVLALGTSLSLAAPVAFAALKIEAHRGWIIAATALFMSALATGTYARLTGSLTIMTPKKLHDKWLRLDEEIFKRYAVYFSGKHLEKNRRLLVKRHRLLVAVTLLFLLEMFCLTVAVAPRLGSPSQSIQDQDEPVAEVVAPDCRPVPAPAFRDRMVHRYQTVDHYFQSVLLT